MVAIISQESFCDNYKGVSHLMLQRPIFTAYPVGGGAALTISELTREEYQSSLYFKNNKQVPTLSPR